MEDAVVHDDAVLRYSKLEECQSALRSDPIVCAPPNAFESHVSHDCLTQGALRPPDVLYERTRCHKTALNGRQDLLCLGRWINGQGSGHDRLARP